ncbi:MAG: V-type ATP synthase subunit E [Archangium sp.]|nr:V-type ATP synthase subunit E [Archangium sp.]
MALEDLIARLERDADVRSSQLELDAEAEATALRGEAARVAQQRRDRELGSRRTRRRAQLDAALAEARRQTRGARLAAQHALLQRIFARARALVPELARSEAYLSQVAVHCAEARRYLEGVRVVVRCQPALVERLREPGLTLLEDAALPPGVVVAAEDGSVFIDNTLPARLERLEAKLAVELLAEVTRRAGETAR